MRFFLSISYKGTQFKGWQRQPSQPTIEQSVEEALSTLFREKIEVVGAGRTDSGVHALNYMAHFNLKKEITEEMFQMVIYKLNAILPPQIVVKDLLPVSSDAHARFDAQYRRYRYYIHSVKEPFIEEHSLFFPYHLNIERMNEAAKYLLGRQNFSSMAKLHSNRKTDICTVTDAKWERYLPNHHTPYGLFNGEKASLESSPYLYFEIVADRFLRDMVRAICGTLLEVGRERREATWVEKVLKSEQRANAGHSVAPQGLFYMGAHYPYKSLDGRVI